jgi:hypothetical protein
MDLFCFLAAETAIINTVRLLTKTIAFHNKLLFNLCAEGIARKECDKMKIEATVATKCSANGWAASPAYKQPS